MTASNGLDLHEKGHFLRELVVGALVPSGTVLMLGPSWRVMGTMEIGPRIRGGAAAPNPCVQRAGAPCLS